VFGDAIGVQNDDKSRLKDDKSRLNDARRRQRTPEDATKMIID